MCFLVIILTVCRTNNTSVHNEHLISGIMDTSPRHPFTDVWQDDVYVRSEVHQRPQSSHRGLDFESKFSTK